MIQLSAWVALAPCVPINLESVNFITAQNATHNNQYWQTICILQILQLYDGQSIRAAQHDQTPSTKSLIVLLRTES